MKSILVFAVILAFIFSGCSNTVKNDGSQTATEVVATEGAAVISVADLLANPEMYDSKEIALKGTVVHVCKHSGKRLHLLGSDEASQVRLEAGAIGQFEKTLEGSDIIARGVFHIGASGQKAGGNNENHDGPKMQGNGSGQGMGAGMMEGEGEPGEMQGSWIDGISFETVPSE